MRVKLTPLVRVRAEEFGGICYVPQRDDFFALDKRYFELLRRVASAWTRVESTDIGSYRLLGRLGIVRCQTPSVDEAPYSGPSLVGALQDLPIVRTPMVVNCFATSFCPLRCIYCHADDLMQGYRESESDEDVGRVLRTAMQVPSLVAVVTGGDPLSRPKRAEALISGLAETRALVLDTSGIGNLDQLIPCLVRNGVHVRISLDSIGATNDRLRPAFEGRARSASALAQASLSRRGAVRAIQRCLDAGLAVSVQSVVTARNENVAELRDLRDWLCAVGVRNWVIHMAVRGGSAERLEAEAERHTRKRGILPSGRVRQRLAGLLHETIDAGLPIDVRFTDTDVSRNAVLLIGSQGHLYTEGVARRGKVVLHSAEGPANENIALDGIDWAGHTRRYLNWVPWAWRGRAVGEISGVETLS